jgi:hypothetical protein
MSVCMSNLLNHSTGLYSISSQRSTLKVVRELNFVPYLFTIIPVLRGDEKFFVTFPKKTFHRIKHLFKECV